MEHKLQHLFRTLHEANLKQVVLKEGVKRKVWD